MVQDDCCVRYRGVHDLYVIDSTGSREIARTGQELTGSRKEKKRVRVVLPLSQRGPIFDRPEAVSFRQTVFHRIQPQSVVPIPFDDTVLGPGITVWRMMAGTKVSLGIAGLSQLHTPGNDP